MKVPEDLRYTDHDEWIRIEGGEIVVGITDYAQDALGELVHVELPDVGTHVATGDVVCEDNEFACVQARSGARVQMTGGAMTRLVESGTSPRLSSFHTIRQ